MRVTDGDGRQAIHLPIGGIHFKFQGVGALPPQAGRNGEQIGLMQAAQVFEVADFARGRLLAINK